MNGPANDDRFDAALRDLLASRAADVGSMPGRAEVVARLSRRMGTSVWQPLTSRAAWAAIALAISLAVVVASAFLSGGRRSTLISTQIPANGLIAVVANRNLGSMGDIFLVASDAPPRRLVVRDNGLAESCPVFSPDGRRLAYGESRPPGGLPTGDFMTPRGPGPVADRVIAVARIDAEEGTSTPIIRVALPGSGILPCPRWSPDGRRLAVRTEGKLWVIDAASGSRASYPMAGSQLARRTIDWSQDGQHIAVSESDRIRVLDLADGTTRTIEVRGASPVGAAWTADDARLVYTATDTPGVGHAVRIVDADGSNDRQLTADPWAGGLLSDFEPIAISPDRTRLAVHEWWRGCAADGCGQQGERVFIVDLATGHRTTVEALADRSITGLGWSPDGKRLLFSSAGGIGSVALDGGSPPMAELVEGLDLEWTGEEIDWQPRFP